MTLPSLSPVAPIPLLEDFSLVVGRRQVRDLGRAGTVIPPDTMVLVGLTDSMAVAAMLETVRALRALGFLPVPVVAAKRLPSAEMLSGYLSGLRQAGAAESILLVGGDPEQPSGPYADAASVLTSGLLEEHGVRTVYLAGYPEGHLAIADDVLWSALAAKVAELERRGLDGGVIAQFGFDPARTLAWLAGLRARGITLPAWLGVTGPATARQLLWFAAKCGVSVSPEAARQYGFSLTDPAADTTPERFLRALQAGYDPRLHGRVMLRLETFGGVAPLTEWLSRVK
jgi:methylenetetrahydrofolate reductase (NADPH)